MPTHYLDTHDIAKQTGRTDQAIRQLHKRSQEHRKNGTPKPTDLPEPDAIIGTIKPRPGWSQPTIITWINSQDH